VDPKYSIPQRIFPVCPPAYEACLKGNFFRDKLTPQDLEKSIALFTQAIDLDPAYAQAYGDLSRSYFYLGLFGMEDPGKVFPKARRNAVKALELDDTVASAHNAMAVIHIFHDWDWVAAETECRRAVELDPGASVTHAHFADYMSIRGRHEEAIAEFGRVLELDPLSREHNAWFALILYRARRYDESIAQGRKALDLDSHNPNAHWFLALSLEQKGQLPEAVAELEKAVGLSGGSYHRALLSRAYALAGETAKALNILGELKELSQRRYVSPFDIAVAYAGLGDGDAAFHWLGEAYRQRVFRIIELTMPMFDNLRSDPRWQDLVSRIGLL
jgi:tetratricopeptide (TPR) repeat protein